MDQLSRNRLLLNRVNSAELFYPLSVGEVGEKKLTYFQLDDEYVGFAIGVTALNGASEQHVSQINRFISKHYPHGTIIQVSMFGGPNVYGKTRLYRDFHKNTGQPFLDAFISSRVEYLEQATKTGIDRASHNLLKSFECVVSIKIPKYELPLKKDLFDQEIEKIISESFEILGAIGLMPYVMDANEYVKFVQSILNWDDNAYWKNETTDLRATHYDPSKPVRDSFFEPGNRLSIDDHENLRLGRKHVALMSVQNYPEYICIHDIVRLIGNVKDGHNEGLRNHFLMTVNIIVEDQHKERGRFEKKKMSNQRQAFGKMAQWVPEYGRRQVDFDSMKKQMDDGSSILRVMHTITLFADSKRELDSACSSMQSYWNGKEFEFYRDSFIALPVFLQQIPLNTDYQIYNYLGRYWTMPSIVVANSLPLVTEWEGGYKPAMIMTTRLGAPAFFDLYESSTSFSGLIVAESGSGKSVLAQYLVASYQSYRDQNTQVCRTWIIDIGGSYKRYCKRVNGSYIDFRDHDLVINPFETVKTEEDYKDSVEMLLGIISVMASPTETQTDLQKSAMRDHLRSVWSSKHEQTTIDDIAKSFLTDEYEEVRRLGRQIRPYTTAGDFGKYFNGKSNVDMHQNELVVLELEGLKESATLQRSVLYMIMYSITRAVNDLPKHVRKNILVDEGWALISKSEDVAQFLEGMYRTIRKKFGACIFISQGIKDINKSPSGRAIADNSPNKLLLGQQVQAIESAKRDKDIVLDDYGWEQLKSVKTIRGVYSEIFVMQGSRYGVLRLAMSRESVLLFTTDPNEVALLDAIENQGYSAEEAIKLFVDYEEKGRLHELQNKFLNLNRGGQESEVSAATLQ
ncbi:MAG: hypothetical protein C9356_15720 [Oleiphilus sp.]|nr:MAG: hypothetical protein C9356_15720 [Oleiphilus sp.]